MIITKDIFFFNFCANSFSTTFTFPTIDRKFSNLRYNSSNDNSGYNDNNSNGDNNSSKLAEQNLKKWSQNNFNNFVFTNTQMMK